MDDQCNQSVASPEIFHILNITSLPMYYTLTKCSGKTTLNDRHTIRLELPSFEAAVTMDLPLLMECDDFDVNAKIELLIGRDLIEAHTF